MKWLRVRLGSAVITFLFSIALVTSLNFLKATLIGSPSANDLRLTIRSASGAIRVFEDSDLEVELTNLGKETVTLVAPGDGSSYGWRTPFISWSIIDANTNTQLIEPRGFRCGNQNSLRYGEVFRLSPGETRRFQHVRPTIYRAGVYRVALTYKNEPSAKFRGWVMGFHNPIEMWRLRHSTKASVTSNELLLTVVRD